MDNVLYKYIDSTTIKAAPSYIRERGMVITNPPEKMLKDLGFKELQITEYPETQEGYYRAPIYTDGEIIIKNWSTPILEVGTLVGGEH